MAFNIYFVMAWRAGETAPLQSSLMRAVVFSALTTATAWGAVAVEPSRHRQHGSAADGLAGGELW